MTTPLSEQLEQIIDSKGLPYVLDKLAEICQEKANHIRENWQDNKLGLEWDKIAWSIQQVSQKAEHL
jgi:hypothetical protein